MTYLNIGLALIQFVTLAWNAPEGNVDHYRVYWQPAGLDEAYHYDISDVTSCRAPLQGPWTRYWVTTIYNGNESEPSNSVRKAVKQVNYTHKDAR